MKYVSLCDGIGAAHEAWKPLGWQCLAVAEIDPFCNAVVEYHHRAPNLGDLTKITKERILEHGKPDIIIGGTPCQAFSVAGKQLGTSDPRGRLTETFFRLVGEVRPTWFVWENVPGVLSIERGRVFSSILRTVEEFGYWWAYRTMDAQFFRVPQRRRRVVLVGYFGDGNRAGEVLFESESLPWNPPPRGSEGQGDPGTVANCLRAQGQLAHRLDVDNILAANTITGKCRQPEMAYSQLNLVADTVTAKWAKGSGGPAGDECQNLVAVPIAEVGKRTGRSTKNPSHGIGVGKDGDPMFTLQASSQHGVGCHIVQKTAPTLLASEGGPSNGYTPIIAFDCKQANDFNNDRCPTLRSMNADKSHVNGGGMAAAYLPEELDVRRLTPRECERLQGFPDDYTYTVTRVGKNGRVVYTSDTQRYKMIGNSMAVPVFHWVGRRIQMIHDLYHNEKNMPKKATKKTAKTKTMEIPVTAFDREKIPDAALIEQWNECYPPGTEVFIFGGNLYKHDIAGGHVDLYRTKPIYTKTVSKAFSEKSNGTEPLVDLDIDPSMIDNGEDDSTVPLRFMVFPVECFPDHKKYIDDQKCLAIMGMKNAKPSKPGSVSDSMKRAILGNPEGAARFYGTSTGKEKPAKKAVKKKAIKESPEKMKQRQLESEYAAKTEIESRLFDSEVIVQTCKNGIRESVIDRKVIERMLYSPENPPSDPGIRKYLFDEIEERTRTIQACQKVISEQAAATKADRQRHQKIKDRIHRLHTVGPDPQQEFEMETEA